jgi:hypothetical protein
LIALHGSQPMYAIAVSCLSWYGHDFSTWSATQRFGREQTESKDFIDSRL